jgi:hypothetical protein
VERAVLQLDRDLEQRQAVPVGEHEDLDVEREPVDA